MFLIPANLEQFHEENPPKKIKTILDWQTVHQKMPWGVIILLGGGFALAEGTQVITTKVIQICKYLLMVFDLIEIRAFRMVGTSVIDFRRSFAPYGNDCTLFSRWNFNRSGQ
jgi:di/tricarboxylate transporter